jgi:hypothetical protein
MDPESINALEIERLRRINAGVPKSLADRSDLVNEAVMARFGKNSQPAA